MSVVLLVAIPLTLLAVVFLRCFLGCGGFIPANIPPFYEYTESLLAEPTLIAYWSLGGPEGQVTADKRKGTSGVHVRQRIASHDDGERLCAERARTACSLGGRASPSPATHAFHGNGSDKL
jgi:hypothetical protein